jgi:trimeric autotransporter adhesin
MINQQIVKLCLSNSLALLFVVALFLIPSVSQSQTCSGVVFRDYNGNGSKDFAEPYLAGITVKAFNAAGTQVGVTATSAALTGAWSITTGTTATVRVEFTIPTNAAAQDYTSASGSTYGSSVQFVAGNATTVNFAANYPSDYTTSNPILATPCYLNGSRAANSSEPVVVLFNNLDRGQGVPHPIVANFGEVGSVWGNTYNPSNKKLYVSAFIKRHMDLPPDGLGAIYEIDLTTPTTAGAGTPTLWLNINAATFVNQSNVAVNLGFPADPGAASRGLGIKTAPSRDNWGFANMGRQGIGDIELSEDGQRMYVMDLTNRQVLCIDYTTKKLIWKLAVSTPACLGGGGDIRPWGLKEYKGVLYVGTVCSGETNQNGAQLHYYVMKCNSLTAATSMSVAVNMGNARAKQSSEQWDAWLPTTAPSALTSLSNNDYFNYNQPIVSDIEFDKNDNMIIGVMDRMGHLGGNGNYIPNVTNTNVFFVIAYGDITRAVNSGGTYTIETAPWSFFYLAAAIPSPPLDQFTGGMVVTNLDDNYVVANMIDPFDYDSGGIIWDKTSDGQQQGGTNATGRLEIIPPGTDVSTYGKASSLGDLALLNPPAPLEIGNRIWTDTDKDGIQDADETGINSVTVLLFEGAVQVGSTTTASGGQYYFTSANVTGGIKYNTAYEIRIAKAQAPLSNLALTTTDVGSNGSDFIDSDGTVLGTNIIKAFTTGSAGQNNHSYDFGFFSCPTITSPSATQTLCIGATGSNITVNTNYNSANGIRFVKFTSDQSPINGSETATELGNIYAGTALSTVTPTGASSPYTATYTWNGTDFPNATSSPITYYVYAILNPDLGATCRPVQEIQITVNPKPTTPSVSTPKNNICPATTVNLNTYSAALTPSVSGGVFEWHTTSSSGSSLVGTPTAVSNGTYYLFEKSTAACFSTATSVQVVIVTCCPTSTCLPAVATRSVGRN